MSVLLSTTCLGLAALMLGTAPGGPAQVDAGQGSTDGLLLRIGGDAVVPVGADYDAVIVFDGDATVSGTADFVLVVGGEALLSGATVGHIIVADGALALKDGTEVTGDVELFRSRLDRVTGVTVGGRIRERPLQHTFKGVWFFGVFLAIGVAAAIVGAGVVAIAFAGDGVEQVGRSMLTRLPQTLVGAVVLWVVLPLAALIMMPTIVAVPAGVGLFLLVLPLLGFVGFVLAGIALGRAVLHSLRPIRRQESPYLASVLGITLLLMAGLLPMVGALVAPLAGAVGSGALAATLWQRAMDRRLGARGVAPA